jgi:hypothetical protein
MPLPLATGFKKNWKNKANPDSGHPEEPVHAITDEHALSVRPQFDKCKQGEVAQVSVQV